MTHSGTSTCPTSPHLERQSSDTVIGKSEGNKDWNTCGSGAILGHKTKYPACERRASEDPVADDDTIQLRRTTTIQRHSTSSASTNSVRSRQRLPEGPADVVPTGFLHFFLPLYHPGTYEQHKHYSTIQPPATLPSRSEKKMVPPPHKKQASCLSVSRHSSGMFTATMALLLLKATTITKARPTYCRTLNAKFMLGVAIPKLPPSQNPRKDYNPKPCSSNVWNPTCAGNEELIGALMGTYYLQAGNEGLRRNIVVHWLLGRAAKLQVFDFAKIFADHLKRSTLEYQSPHWPNEMSWQLHTLMTAKLTKQIVEQRKPRDMLLISYGNCHRAVNESHLRPYRLHVVQELKHLVLKKCVHYYRWFPDLFTEWTHTINRHSDDNMETVNTKEYGCIFNEFVEQLDESCERYFIQQDGATFHTYNVSRDFITSFFDD
ncbi:hypothetical protein PR048_022220 [Dryococelus australis]|uniref:Uncharacterized protein n=1 Tax=Dryococelus australis TaxID=614101 RepID=A0ABQ9H0I5_9NEOP|nr:hypothetical protein PR048_022220 [Dryococelus australis]